MFGTSKLYLALALAVVTACGDDGGAPANTAPTLEALTLTTDEDKPVTGNLVVSDAENDPVTFALGTPAHGTLIRAANAITYTPGPNFHGTDSVDVTVSDGALDTTVTVTITVTPVDDAPVTVADAFATAEDTALALAPTAVLANDIEVDGDALTVSAVGNATNGTVALVAGELVFTPAADFSGTATFEYTASDGDLTDVGSVTVTVGGANDAPIAGDDAVTTDEDTAATIPAATLLANDTDAENQTLIVTAVDSATNGTVALAGTDITFTPAANFHGTATFAYTVSDGMDTDTGTVTITVTAVNDAPVAVDDAATTAEDTALEIAAAALALDDLDIDGDTLTVSAVANAVNGTVALAAGQITFTPAAGFTGDATFEYTVSDGTASDVGLVTVTVTAVDDAPVATDDDITAESGVPTAIPAAQLLANDTDSDSAALTITAVGNASNGTVSLAGTTITYTSAAGFTGAATFDYTVGDGTTTDTGTVHVTVITSNVCGDGVLFGLEACDDNDTMPGDGCSATCQVETGWSCAGTPSACTSICGDGRTVGTEACDDGDTAAADGCSATCTVETGYTCTGAPSVCATTCGDGTIAGAEICDDGNTADADGCTSACVPGVVCDATAFSDGDAFAVDATTGSCYVAFDADFLTFADAQTACAGIGGYLATITSSAEQALVTGIQNDAENPWIGASEDGNDTDAVFRWVTGEVFGYTNFAPGQPDDDALLGGNGECLHLVDATGAWNDTNCDISTFVTGRICEVELAPCGDRVVQTAKGEQCDDGNTTAGDGCSATCMIEPLVAFSFTGATTTNATFPADGAAPAGLESLPVMSRGTGISAASGSNFFTSNGWGNATLDPTEYHAFTVTPAAGRTLNLTSLRFLERRSSSGPVTWALRSSLDGFATDIATAATNTADTTHTIELPAAFVGLTAAVELRIYAFGAPVGSGTWRNDDVLLFGTATAP